MASIKEQIEEKIKNNGTISSAELSGTVDESEGVDASNETSRVKSSREQFEKDEPLLKDNGATQSDLTHAERIGFTEEIEITAEDKKVFLDAIVQGERFERPFSIFGGKLTGRIRSRLRIETRAIATLIRTRMDAGTVKSQAELEAVQRPAMLATQISELNGTTYPELPEPLLPAMGADGNMVAPGWYTLLDKWMRRDDSVVEALFKEIRKFEFKYWTMTDMADDQDFWLPAERI